MLRFALLVGTVVVTGLALTPIGAGAQATSWRPPSRDMPAMPRMGELGGDWMGPRQSWFRDVESLSGVAAGRLRAAGEARPGSDVAMIVRFTSGPLPVVIWSDLGGDGRADLIEMYRSGGVIIQLVDSDWDGTANVVRFYDASGALIREDRL